MKGPLKSHEGLGHWTSRELSCKQDPEGKEEVGGLRIFYLVFEVIVLFKKASLI